METEKRISPRARKLEKTLAKKLSEFLSSDVLYSLRRVLAAEMKHVYLGPDRMGKFYHMHHGQTSLWALISHAQARLLMSSGHVHIVSDQVLFATKVLICLC